MNYDGFDEQMKCQILYIMNILMTSINFEIYELWLFMASYADSFSLPFFGMSTKIIKVHQIMTIGLLT